MPFRRTSKGDDGMTKPKCGNGAHDHWCPNFPQSKHPSGALSAFDKLVFQTCNSNCRKATASCVTASWQVNRSVKGLIPKNSIEASPCAKAPTHLLSTETLWKPLDLGRIFCLADWPHRRGLAPMTQNTRIRNIYLAIS